MKLQEYLGTSGVAETLVRGFQFIVCAIVVGAWAVVNLILATIAEGKENRGRDKAF